MKQLLTLNKRKRGRGLGWALLVVEESDGVAWRGKSGESFDPLSKIPGTAP